jgi:hypothetical protein
LERKLQGCGCDIKNSLEIDDVSNLDYDCVFSWCWGYRIYADRWRYLASFHTLLGTYSFFTARFDYSIFSTYYFLTKCQTELRTSLNNFCGAAKDDGRSTQTTWLLTWSRRSRGQWSLAQLDAPPAA